MEINEIVRELEYYQGYKPEKALLAAVEQKEEIIPELLKLCRKAIANFAYVELSSRYNGYLYAFYLLAQFRVKEGFALITEFFTFMNGDSYDFTGYVITQDLCRILASVFDDDWDTVNSITLDSRLYEFTRVAFMDLYLIMFEHKQISRENLIKSYRKIFQYMKREPSFIWERLISYCQAIHAKELIEEITLAYKDNLVDTFEFPEDKTFAIINDDLPVHMGQFELDLIDDVIADTSWWSDESPLQEKDFYTDMSSSNKEIIKELEYYNGYYPHEALAKAAENKEAIIPDLLKIIEWTTENLIELENIDYICPIYACYLLAQFKEKRAFPVIINFVTSGYYSEEAYSEFIFFNLSEILADCYNGDHELIKKSILNNDLTDYVRSGLMECFIVLYKYKEIKRETLLNILTQLFEELEREYFYLWEKIIKACMVAKTTELIKEIEAAYKDIFIYFPLEITLEIISDSKKEIEDMEWFNKFDGEIKDTEWWDCIKLEEPDDIYFSYLERNESLEKIEKNIANREYTKTLIAKPDKPYIREEEKIGRNAPCPCGSGKKYKKCCGKNI